MRPLDKTSLDDRVVAFAQELVRIDSTPGHERAVIERVVDEMRSLGYHQPEVDPAGNAHVTGFTSSANFPITSSAWQTTYGGGSQDGFVTSFFLADTSSSCSASRRSPRGSRK